MEKNKAFELIREIDTLTKELKGKRFALDLIQNSCQHVWGETKTRYVEHEGRHIPAEGRGSDFTGSYDIPARTETFYSRTCTICGKFEETDKIKVTNVPKRDIDWGKR